MHTLWLKHATDLSFGTNNGLLLMHHKCTHTHAHAHSHRDGADACQMQKIDLILEF